MKTTGMARSSTRRFARVALGVVALLSILLAGIGTRPGGRVVAMPIKVAPEYSRPKAGNGSAAVAATFINVGTVKGESTDSKHQTQIEL